MTAPVYLDYNATAKVRPLAAAAVADALAEGGNPSSVHAAGRAARATVEAARRAVAALVGAAPETVTFTGGGTEANALAIRSAAADGARRILVSATEHDCVRAEAEATGLPVEIWPVDAHGLADLRWLSERVAADGRPLVCMMLANNETGVAQPMVDVGTITGEAGGWLHVDAVQAAGKIEIDFESMWARSLAISAHKLGGPQGVGALISEGPLTPQFHGGGQERGRRPGTENVPGIAGFGAAALAAVRDMAALTGQSAWRDALAARIVELGGVVLGDGAERLPQTLCVATPGFASELQVMALDLAGVMISAGAACSSGKVKASRVVEAMGRPDLAPFAVRISGGWATTRDDWRRCGEAWIEARHRQSKRIREFA
ncbi:MAG: cysteine desulfurase family protein [Caulobacteraceae bacterium]